MTYPEIEISGTGSVAMVIHITGLELLANKTDRQRLELVDERIDSARFLLLRELGVQPERL